MSEVDDTLNAYMTGVEASRRYPLPELAWKMVASAFLSGYGAGLERGGELAERSWNTALETLREHYPEASGNALRNYLSRPDEDAQASEGDPPQGLPSAWSDTHPE